MNMKMIRSSVLYLLPALLLPITGSVLPSGIESDSASSMSRKIDDSYSKIWSEKGITPAPLSTDEEFVRRAYLDITGRIPTAAQAEAFLKSHDQQKREKLLARLVESDEFAEYFASLFTALFLGYRNDPYVDRIEFQKWMQTRLRASTGWDKIENEMIVASGNLVD